jgi:hypothetical protein
MKSSCTLAISIMVRANILLLIRFSWNLFIVFFIIC